MWGYAARFCDSGTQVRKTFGQLSHNSPKLEVWGRLALYKKEILLSYCYGVYDSYYGAGAVAQDLHLHYCLWSLQWFYKFNLSYTVELSREARRWYWVKNLTVTGRSIFGFFKANTSISIGFYCFCNFFTNRRTDIHVQSCKEFWRLVSL